MKKQGKSQDIRMMRPVVARDKKTGQVLTLQQSDSINIGSCEFSFNTPNNVSIFVNISKRELNISKKHHNDIFKAKAKAKKEITLDGKELSKLYTYLEHIQSCVISVYTAIEALANVAIPNNHEYKVKNSKGVMETWDKEAIERWFKTSDKYTKVLPEILKIDSPSSQPFWSKFKELESIRNDIIHQKTSIKKSTDIDSGYLARLLQPKVFDNIEAGYELIAYICNANISHAFFPLGFGPAQISVEEFEDFSKSFKLVKSASNT